MVTSSYKIKIIAQLLPCALHVCVRWSTVVRPRLAFHAALASWYFRLPISWSHAHSPWFSAHAIASTPCTCLDRVLACIMLTLVSPVILPFFFSASLALALLSLFHLLALICHSLARPWHLSHGRGPMLMMSGTDAMPWCLHLPILSCQDLAKYVLPPSRPWPILHRSFLPRITRLQI